MLKIEEIQRILPQRFPFLLIDNVIEVVPNLKVVAIKNVTINEAFFQGHFPGRPIMPGVLIVEAMAQAAIILFYSSKQIESAKKLSYYLGSIKIKFLNPVIPGDQLKITVEPMKMVSRAAIVRVSASVADKDVARGEMSISIKENG